MLRSSLLPLGLGLAVLAAGCGGSEPQATRAAASVTEQLPAGRIVFRRYSDAAQTHGAIFTIRTDGTRERRLTNPPVGTSDDKPDWSPDGKQVVFQHCGESIQCSIWTMPATGGKATAVRVHCRLKGGDCDASDPSWTPDGRIVLTLSQGSVRTLGGQDQIQQSEIELVDPRTGHQRTIIALKGWKGDLLTPAMSPDRRTVAYTHSNAIRIKPSAGEALFTVGVDGRGNRRVAPWDLGGGDGPSFSPTGTILFRSHAGHDDNRQSDFWTVRRDGSDLKQLTHFKEGTLVRSASYSPDGDWIVSATDGVGGNADLFAMQANGTGKVFITHTELWDSAPDWSPKEVTR
jgi:TolB protein